MKQKTAALLARLGDGANGTGFALRVKRLEGPWYTIMAQFDTRPLRLPNLTTPRARCSSRRMG